MRILYYIPIVSQEGGGLRQYCTALLSILGQDSANTYFILHQNNDPEILKISKSHNNLVVIPSGISKERKWEYFIYIMIKTYNTIYRIKKRSNFKPIIWSYVDRICKKYKIDLIHSPFQTVPYSKTKIIWTLHDVQELHFPEYFDSYERAERSRSWLENISVGNHIIVSYKHIKDDIIKYFKINEDNISICLLDMQNLWIDSKSHLDINRQFLNNLPQKFLLYPANTWPHKNHKLLIEAVKILRDNLLLDIVFICTGHQTEYFFNEIQPLITKYKLENNFIFAGIVNEKDLYSLYLNARCVVIPTIYEAGSFPLMESILLNIPVICSNVTSLPETIKNHKFIFDPFDPNHLSFMLEQAWLNDSFIEESRYNSKIQSSTLKTNTTLEILSNIYSKII